MTHPSSILIIGAGQAGGCAAAALRKEGFAGAITLVGEESHRPYERPPLSKTVLGCATQDDSIFLHQPDYHEALNLNWLPGVRVEAIDATAQLARVTEGRDIAFDRCLIATGGRARPLPGAVENSPNIYYLRSLDDARRLRARMRPGGRATVIGGGFLGLEFASTAIGQGMEVTVCEAGEQLLGKAVPTMFGEWLCARYEQAGVRVIRGAEIQSVTSDEDTKDSEDSKSSEHGATVILADGSRLESDFVLVAIGQVPNVDLAQRTGIAIDNGITVDERCETSLRGIFAAGDCASHYSPFIGRRLRIESWQNAQEQAHVAAKAMLGMPASYDVVPWFWSDQLGMNLQMLGLPDPGYRYVLRGSLTDTKFSIYGFDGQNLRYALVVNSGGEVRPLRNLLESKKPIDSDRLIDTSRPVRDLVKAALS